MQRCLESNTRDIFLLWIWSCMDSLELVFCDCSMLCRGLSVERLAFVCGKNVWSSVALVEVRVMMAVTMYIFETLFVLNGVRELCVCCMG